MPQNLLTFLTAGRRGNGARESASGMLFVNALRECASRTLPAANKKGRSAAPCDAGFSLPCFSYCPGTGGRRQRGSPLSVSGSFALGRALKDQSSFLLLAVITRNAAIARTMQLPTARTLLSDVGGGSIGMLFVIAVTVPSTTVDVSL